MSDQIGGSRFGDIALETGFNPTKMTAEHILQTLIRLTLEEEANKPMTTNV
jgi:hypothetical protein